MKKSMGYLGLLVGLSLSQLVLAEPIAVNPGDSTPSAGAIAANLTVTSGFFAGLLHSMFYVVGVGLVTASIIQYREFRNNPTQTPLRKPIILFLAGLLIGFFPFIVKYIETVSAGYNV